MIYPQGYDDKTFSEGSGKEEDDTETVIVQGGFRLPKIGMGNDQ